MPTPPDTYKKAPRRATPKGRRVAASPEAKAAYEAIIRAKEERESANQHLPPDMKR